MTRRDFCCAGICALFAAERTRFSRQVRLGFHRRGAEDVKTNDSELLSPRPADATALETSLATPRSWRKPGHFKLESDGKFKLSPNQKNLSLLCASASLR